MANWFECKVQYDKLLENGKMAKPNETYLVDALSFTEAEARIIEERTPYISGEFNVKAVKRSRITEIFRDDTADYWYLAKVDFVTLDEKSMMEKHSVSNMLVAGNDFKGAYENLLKGMSGTLADYEIVSLAKSPILEVYNVKLSHAAPKQNPEQPRQ